MGKWRQDREEPGLFHNGALSTRQGIEGKEKPSPLYHFLAINTETNFRVFNRGRFILAPQIMKELRNSIVDTLLKQRSSIGDALLKQREKMVLLEPKGWSHPAGAGTMVGLCSRSSSHLNTS